jgi:uncharacterized SAM-binding protein YcdF (DUF218 family)
VNLRLSILGLIVLLSCALIDFGLFFRTVLRPAPHEIVMADGIAVLTGARERISVAVRMLSENKGHRLLISGVNERTNPMDLLRIEPSLEPLMACCVDLGRKATNTIGNAQEISAWARMHHYQTLWLVTSDYHMPRALLEVHHANPDLKLYPRPVSSVHEREDATFKDPSFWRLTASEWFKFNIVWMRIAFGLPINDNE